MKNIITTGKTSRKRNETDLYERSWLNLTVNRLNLTVNRKNLTVNRKTFFKTLLRTRFLRGKKCVISLISLKGCINKLIPL